jgi:hydrogenase maturation factor
LLVSIAEDALDEAMRSLQKAGVAAHLIGTVVSERTGAIRLH